MAKACDICGQTHRYLARLVFRYRDLYVRPHVCADCGQKLASGFRLLVAERGELPETVVVKYRLNPSGMAERLLSRFLPRRH